MYIKYNIITTKAMPFFYSKRFFIFNEEEARLKISEGLKMLLLLFLFEKFEKSTWQGARGTV